MIAKVFLKQKKLSEEDYTFYCKKTVQELLSQITSAKSIAIKTNLFTKEEYPFGTNIFLVVSLIKELRKEYQGELFLIEKKFKDTSVHAVSDDILEFFDQNQVKIVLFTEYDLIGITEVEGAEPSFHLPLQWINADARILLANSRIHTHHAVKTEFDLIAELGFFASLKRVDWTKFNKNQVWSILKDELHSIGHEVIKLTKEEYPVYGILDKYQVTLTNEHSMFLRSEEGNGVILSSSLF